MMPPALDTLYAAVVSRYDGCGRYARNFVHHKLRRDPVFYDLLRNGRLPDRGTLIDLGCGYGILPALLVAAVARYAQGDWPPDWPSPPRQLGLHGIDVNDQRVRVARRALGAAARIDESDLRDVTLPRCNAVVMLDVLMYMDHPAQEHLLAAVAAALTPDGVLLMRESDAASGLSFKITRWLEYGAGCLRGEWRQRLYYRSAAEWVELLQRLGFTVTSEPMGRGTPFANVLLTARRNSAAPTAVRGPAGFLC